MIPSGTPLPFDAGIIDARAIAHFQSRILPEPMSGCWLWTGAVNRKGYGTIWLGPNSAKKRRLAHRFSYEFHNGQVPTGLLVCHRCDTPACVNPDHLYAGTAADNSSDMVARGNSTKGTRNPSALLSEPDVMAIRRRLAGGEPHRTIAADYHISAATVGAINRGILWGWL